MEYFKKILRFARPYRKYAVLNIIANIFYALFGTLAMISLFPMLSVLFKQTEALYTPPTWEGISNTKTYVEQALNYFVTQKASEGEGTALLFMVGLVIGMFFLKNLFGYLAMFFITFLRNGVLKDLRNALYDKSISLPLSTQFLFGKEKGRHYGQNFFRCIRNSTLFFICVGISGQRTTNHSLYHHSHAAYEC